MTNVLMKGQIQRLATVELWRLVGRHVPASGSRKSLVSNQIGQIGSFFTTDNPCIDHRNTVNCLRRFLSSSHPGHFGHLGHPGHSGHSNHLGHLDIWVIWVIQVIWVIYQIQHYYTD